MTTLIIARHGNTFEKGETPRRVGARTDLPLTDTGRRQARMLGAWLKRAGLRPEAVYCSELQRTKETARLALEQADYKEPVFPLAMFNEVDYGPDENKTDDAVIARIGEDALGRWERENIVPDGWVFDPDACIKNWKNFAAHIVADRQDCVMVVTSNGIARFAPHITGDYAGFLTAHSPKIATGAVCVFSYDNGRWHLMGWDIKSGIDVK